MGHYILMRSETPADALARLLHGCIEAAQVEIAHGHAGVHQARKRIREARSCLALGRAGCGRTSLRMAKALKTAAHRLADMRDADAHEELLGKLTEEPHEDVSRRGLFVLRGVIMAVGLRARRDLPEALASAAAALEIANAELPELRFRGGWKTLLAGHERSHRDALATWRAAKRERSEKALHAWRKRLKDLRHQTHILSPVLPHVLDGWSDAWHEASDHLGEHRDLKRMADLISDEQAAQELHGDLRRRGKKLVKRVLTLGNSLHSVGIATHMDSLRAWLRGWRS